MRSDLPTLAFNGYLRLDLPGIETDWIAYSTPKEGGEVVIDFDKGKTETGTSLQAGLYYGANGEWYMRFMQDPILPSDQQIFTPNGFLRYDNSRQAYSISPPVEQFAQGEDNEKKDSPYLPQTFTYSVEQQVVTMQGIADLVGDDKNFGIEVSALGAGRLGSKPSFNLRAMGAIEMEVHPKIMAVLAQSMQETLMAVSVEPSKARDVNFYGLAAHWAGHKATFRYESTGENKPLLELSNAFNKDIFFNHLALSWDPRARAWYSTGKLDVAHIAGKYINAQFDGYVLIKRSSLAPDVDILLQVTPTVWYYIGYHHLNLTLMSGVGIFNTELKARLQRREPVQGVFSVTAAKSGEIATFIKRFATKYAPDQPPLELHYKPY